MPRSCSFTVSNNDRDQCITRFVHIPASPPSESIRERLRHNRASPRKLLLGAGGSLEFSHLPISTPPESPCSFQGSPRPPLIREKPTAHLPERIGSGNLSEESYISDRESLLRGSHSPSSTRSSSECQFDRFADPTVSAICASAYDPHTPIAIPVTLANSNSPTSTAGSPLSNESSVASPGRTQFFRSHLPSSLSATAHIFPLEYETIELRYEIMETLGVGGLGVVRRCIERNTGLAWACKTINKHNLRDKKDVASLKNEVAAMLELMDHSAVVTLHDVVEDEESVNLVMEFCSGGELFEVLVRRKKFPEAEAARVVRSVISVVHAMHTRGMMHRDLKPENVVLANEDSATSVRVVDFGHAIGYRAGQTFGGLYGSAYYVAPEVILGKYGPEVDVWSTGVILYALLCGRPPFWAEEREDIFSLILAGKFESEKGPWRRISHEAKDLVKRMLTIDPRARITPSQVKKHPYMIRYCAPRLHRIHS